MAHQSSSNSANATGASKRPFAADREASIRKLQALGYDDDQIAELAIDAEYGLTPKQLELNDLLRGPQRHTLLYGGSRSGKTVLYVRAIMWRALIAPGSRHGMFRFRGNAAKNSLWLDTVKAVHRRWFPDIPMRDRYQDGYISFYNESEIWIGGLDEKDRVEKVLGMEFATLYFNECSQIVYPTVTTVLTRLAQVCEIFDEGRPTGEFLKQRAYYDLNPTGNLHYTSLLFIRNVDPLTRQPLKDTAERRYGFINPRDNLANLSTEYLESLDALPERQRKRFFEGVYQTQIDGALWTFESLEAARCDPEDVPKTLRRVVVAVDPSGTKGDENARSDEVGIIVAGLGDDGKVYVLADRTCNLPPEGWGRVVVTAYHEFKADRVVAETNFGGDLVRFTVHQVDRNIPYRPVPASRGKAVRAEPVSVLYGREKDGEWVDGKVRHVGVFSALEDQMLNFSSAGYMGDRSPDRADALVWAVSDLMVAEFKDQGAFEYMRELAAEATAKRAPPPKPETVWAIGSVEWAEQQRRKAG